MPSLPLTVVQQWHPEVFSWVDRTRQAGGSVSTFVASAINMYVQQMNNAGLWQRMKAGNGIVVPYASNSFAGCLTPLITPVLGTATTALTSSAYSLNSGLTGDGTNQVLFTDYKFADLLSRSNIQLCIYSRTNRGEGGLYPEEIAGYGPGTTGYTMFHVYLVNYGDKTVFDIGNDLPPGRAEVTFTSGLGLLSAIRIADNDARFFRNGSQVGSTATNALTTQALSNGSMRVLSAHSIRTHAYMYVGPALTAAQEAIHYSAVQQLQTALGRAV